MALLHSRIGHVYYDTPTSHGALGTAYKLHCNEKLNHNFLVTRPNQSGTSSAQGRNLSLSGITQSDVAARPIDEVT